MWNKAENLGLCETPRSYNIKLENQTFLKRNSKWLRLPTKNVVDNDPGGDNMKINGKKKDVKDEGVEVKEKRIVKKPEWLEDYF